MLNRILVAFDQSTLAEEALTEAIALAKSQGAALRIVHVLSENEPGSPAKLYFNDRQHLSGPRNLGLEQYEQDWNRFVDQWWQRLEALTQTAKLAGISASCDLYQGRAGRQLCQAAQDWHADLIVMGCRELTRSHEQYLGSVSHYVSHRAPCSVYVVHPHGSHHPSLRAAAKGARLVPLVSA